MFRVLCSSWLKISPRNKGFVRVAKDKYKASIKLAFGLTPIKGIFMSLLSNSTAAIWWHHFTIKPLIENYKINVKFFMKL